MPKDIGRFSRLNEPSFLAVIPPTNRPVTLPASWLGEESNEELDDDMKDGEKNPSLKFVMTGLSLPFDCRTRQRYDNQPEQKSVRSEEISRKSSNNGPDACLVPNQI